MLKIERGIFAAFADDNEIGRGVVGFDGVGEGTVFLVGYDGGDTGAGEVLASDVEEGATAGLGEAGFGGLELHELLHEGGLGTEADGAGVVGAGGGLVVGIDEVENVDGGAEALGGPGGVVVNAGGVGGTVSAGEEGGHGGTRHERREFKGED